MIECLALGRLSDMTKKNRSAVALGRRGGKARAKALTKAERVASAKMAIAARWKGHVKKAK